MTHDVSATQHAAPCRRRAAKPRARRGVVRATDCCCVGRFSHHCTTRLPVDVFIRMLVSDLAGRLHRRLARALVQLFLTALRNLAALDFRARRARDGHLDDLVRAGRPEALRRAASACRWCRRAGRRRGSAVDAVRRDRPQSTPRCSIGLSISTFGQHVLQRPVGEQLPLRVVRAPQVQRVGQRLELARRGVGAAAQHDRAAARHRLQRRRRARRSAPTARYRRGCRSSAGSAAGPGRRARPRRRRRRALPGCCCSCRRS